MEAIDLFLVAIVVGTAYLLYRAFFKASGDDLGLGLAAAKLRSRDNASKSAQVRTCLVCVRCRRVCVRGWRAVHLCLT
jgi:hypothetical protein